MMIINIAVALLVTAAQERAVAPPPQEQVEAKSTVEPEKVCKRRMLATGEQGAKALKSIKICKTKEEWEKSKSPPSY